MTRMKSVLTFSGTLLIISNGFFYQCYSQYGPLSSVPQKSVKLEYNLPSGGIKYLNSSKVIQTMDIEGQSMQANVFSALGCSIKQTGRQNGNLLLEVKIDTMGQRTESPQGYSGGAVTDAIGRTFSMTISPSGKESDLSGAKSIVFNIEGSGQNDLSESFSDFFPDLPTTPVSPEYAWTTTDTMNAKTSTMTIYMIIKSENKLEGFEVVEGTECARITSVLSGTREMKVQTQGMDIKMAGPFTGSGTLLFAPANGYFIKHDISTKMTGTMEITYPEAMSFPLLFEMNSVNEVVK